MADKATIESLSAKLAELEQKLNTTTSVSVDKPLAYCSMESLVGKEIKGKENTYVFGLPNFYLDKSVYTAEELIEGKIINLSDKVGDSTLEKVLVANGVLVAKA